MSNLSLPYNIIQDQQNQVKASSAHVQGNFSALETAVNNRLDLDGSNSPTADISMGGHKLTNLDTPTVSSDVATKGYVDAADLLKADLASPTFTGTPKAPTVGSVADNSKKIATTEFVIDVLKAMYPVGTGVFMGTGTTCPLAALFGTWELVASGKALWTGNGANGGTTIAAGLPNITGSVTLSGAYVQNGNGALSGSGNRVNRDDILDSSGPYIMSFNAQNSNPIYGNSTTVQPPAYVVNVWKRVA